jgi:hypothetical protein
VLAVRVSHDARYRVHVSVPVETLSEEGQVAADPHLAAAFFSAGMRRPYEIGTNDYTLV